MKFQFEVSAEVEKAYMELRKRPAFADLSPKKITTILFLQEAVRQSQATPKEPIKKQDVSSIGQQGSGLDT